MERPQRLAALPAVVALCACTMIGAAELNPAPGASASRGDDPIPAAVSDGRSSGTAGSVPIAEPPSRGGNMDRYEQSGGTYRVLDSSEGYDERGVASWYGEAFHGRPTSNGERFDMHQISAAHRTLPLPSYVEVTNLSTGRKLIVRINDRGPFHDPDRRIIDLSYAAARELGIDRTGTAAVRVKAVEPYQTRRPQER